MHLSGKRIVFVDYWYLGNGASEYFQAC